MATSLTLRQLEYVVAVAEAGSVTRAAARLHVSQSAVSMAIADLEHTLGVQLLVRQPRGVTPTSVGRRVLSDARRLLSGVGDLRNAAREEHESMSGQLAVGCYSTLAPIVLPPVIAAFAERHPDVDLRFIEGSHDMLQEQLRHGVLDLALMYHYGPEPLAPGNDLVRTRVLHTPPYVLLPDGHPLAERDKVALRELQDEPLILFDLPPGGAYFRSLFAAEGLAPTVRFRTTSFEMVRALVARGLGYSLLSQRTQIQLSYEGRPFLTRPLAGSHDGLDIDVVQLAHARATLRAEEFIKECHRALTGDADGPAG
ncbi:LysR family transcriptional regulator [Streptomyces cavernicola]|uniref:LysR family transcriptional regulator n=1 Tax=Streptomyces cavernicola TaxID=3043613 RepID=A0ABT6S5K4_9ACTN|nr:LysR family transcriptional regulator [Streptomyces sp. B-S-A6]MDI3403305.1 LysR family transcriptional regulator [Streptomyces sp. B-S-A6]